MSSPPISPDEAERLRVAEDALRRVRRESDTIGGSALARQHEAVESEDDAVERWGKRIGRGLGAIVVLLLIWHFVAILTAGK